MKPVSMIPASDYRLRIVAIMWGVAILAWLSIEDTTTLPVTILGTGASVVGVWLWLTTRYHGQDMGLLLWAVLGASMGMGAIVCATALMFFKTAWHSHLYPDFPTPMLLAMLARVPWWAIAGAMLGLAVALLRQYRTLYNKD
jgi:prepilin signal peptidase PulO-like enzyme (type II secretory pathway)